MADEEVFSDSHIFIDSGNTTELLPGEMDLDTISIDLRNNFAGGTYYVALGILESSKVEDTLIDNFLYRPIQIDGPDCIEDAYEGDDVLPEATPFSLNTVQEHNFCRDRGDWIALDVVAGNSYVLQEWCYRCAGSPELELFDPEGNLVDDQFQYTTEVDPNSNQPLWTPTVSETVYVRIHSRILSHIGPESRYWVTFSEEKPDLVVLPDPASDYVYSGTQGEPQSGRFFVSKEGRTPIAPMSIDVVLSTDDVIDSTDTLLQRYTYPDPNAIPGYDPADSSYFQVDYNFTVPIDLPLGVYYIGFIVDSLNEVDELFEINNAGIVELIGVQAP